MKAYEAISLGEILFYFDAEQHKGGHNSKGTLAGRQDVYHRV